MPDSVIDVAGTKLGYREAGAGATVLFLHGAAGAAWDPLLDRLSDGYRVLAPEHPGFGRGQIPDWMMGVGDVAFFYLDLMQALDLRDVHLVGHGLGGWIAAEIAIRSTARLASLALLAPAGVETREAMFDDIFTWTHGRVRAPAISRSQAGAGVAAGAGQARHRHRAAEPHRAGAARLEPAHAQSAIALLAAPHRCSNLAGLGRGRSGGPVRVPQAVQARNPERRAARPAEVRTRAADRARARESARGSRPSFKEHRDEDVLFPPHALCGSRSELHRASQFGVGHVAQFLFRSRGRAKALSPAISASSSLPTTRLRRHLRQRASSERLRADAGAESDRGRAGAHRRSRRRSRSSVARCRW